MFGELVGLWLADIWIRSGRKDHPLYVELGPGRGTLAADALRAMQMAALTPKVHFVETSEALRAKQKANVPDAAWHHDHDSLPTKAPLLAAANDLFHSLPARQMVPPPPGWRERVVLKSMNG